MDRITFVTGNEGKARYLQQYLSFPIAHTALDIPEVQSLSLKEVALAKAKVAHRQLGVPVLVEDTSLTFTALGALPGPLIKFFSAELGSEGLCTLLDGYEDRSATAEILFVYLSDEEVKLFPGVVHGSIAAKPRGESGFGWDAIFIPEGSTKTFAEMSDDEKHATSMRRIALEDMKRYFTQH